MTYVYLFGGMLAVLLVVVIASVVGDREEEPSTGGEPDPEVLRDAALEALRELEFDFHTGKLPEEEYRRLRRRYGRMALEARDRVAGAGRAAATAEAPAGDPATAAAAAGTGEAADRAFCPACGATLRPSDRFCARCGARRKVREEG